MIDYDQYWITSYNGRNYYFYYGNLGLYKNIPNNHYPVREPDIKNVGYLDDTPIKDSSGNIICPEDFDEIYADTNVLNITYKSKTFEIILHPENLLKLLDFAQKNYMI